MNILEFAINMETEGEKFYRDIAEGNKGNELYPVFIALAEDELRHAQTLIAKKEGIETALEDSRIQGMANLFKNKKQFASETKIMPSQLDSYRKALEKEKESIDLYSRFLAESEDIFETDLFGYLVEQERMHYNLIEDMIFLLEKPESWVESPEFGIREDY